MNQEIEHNMERNGMLKILTVCMAFVLFMGIAIPLYNEINERFPMPEESTATVTPSHDNAVQTSIGSVTFYVPIDTMTTSPDQWLAQVLPVIPLSLRHGNICVVPQEKV